MELGLAGGKLNSVAYFSRVHTYSAEGRTWSAWSVQLDAPRCPCSLALGNLRGGALIKGASFCVKRSVTFDIVCFECLLTEILDGALQLPHHVDDPVVFNTKAFPRRLRASALAEALGTCLTASPSLRLPHQDNTKRVPFCSRRSKPHLPVAPSTTPDSRRPLCITQAPVLAFSPRLAHASRDTFVHGEPLHSTTPSATAYEQRPLTRALEGLHWSAQEMGTTPWHLQEAENPAESSRPASSIARAAPASPPSEEADPQGELHRQPARITPSLLSGRTFTAQQQRLQAQLCERLLLTLKTSPHEGQHQQQSHQPQRLHVSLWSLSQRATSSANAGDARTATSAVVSFLKDFGDFASGLTTPRLAQEAPPAEEEATGPRAALAALSEYCRSTTTANCAELLVQRQVVSVVSACFRQYPQLGASRGGAIREALAIAAAATVTLHRFLGSEPRPKTERGLQRHLRQQQQHQQHQQHQQQVLARSLAATQPKHVTLIRSLLLSIHTLLSDLSRARIAADASNRQLPASSTLHPETVGELSIDLLLLLLPLTLAQPHAAEGQQQTPQQTRIPLTAAGWIPSGELTTDFASTQESEVDANWRQSSSPSGLRPSAALSWRSRSQENAPPFPLPGPASPAAGRAGAAAAPVAQDRRHPVRAECLRCVEALLRLCGRELFPYWSLLLQLRELRYPQLRPLPQDCACLLGVSSTGPQASVTARSSERCLPPSAPSQTALAEPWLWALLGTQQQEQQELPWAFLATAYESPKVSLSSSCRGCHTRQLHASAPHTKKNNRGLSWWGFFLQPPCAAASPGGRLPKDFAIYAFASELRLCSQVCKAVLGCLCALLEAPPLRQWPAAVPTTCMRCEPKALVMPSSTWERLVGPLGFRKTSLHDCNTPEGGLPHSARCPSLTTRQRLGATGAYTSFSRTVSQVSRCAVTALFSIICCYLSGGEAAALRRPPAVAGQENRSAPFLRHAGSTFSPAPPAAAAASAGTLAAMSLRILAEALPALPAGILQPGVVAAAIRVVHPVLLVLVQALELLLQPLPERQKEALCCFCGGEGKADSSAHDWSCLAAAATSVSARQHERQAAASAAAAAAQGWGIRTQALCESNTIGRAVSRQEKPSCPQRGPYKTGNYEAFAAHVVARGPSALRLAGPSLSMLAAVIGGKQRQPQIAEALLLPVSGEASLIGDSSCLAALLCQALQALTTHWGTPLGGSADGEKLPETPPPRRSPRATLRVPGSRDTDSQGVSTARESEASCGGCTAPGNRGGQGRERGEGLKKICSACERHGLLLIDGFFSVLQAVAKRYPQLLLLLVLPHCGLPAYADTGGSETHQGLHRKEYSQKQGGAFLEMIRSVPQSPNQNARCKGLAIAVEILAPSRASASGKFQEEGRRGSRPPQACGLSAAAATKEPPGPLSDDAMLHAPRACLVHLLHSLLIVPLLEGGSHAACSVAAPAAVQTGEQQQPPGELRSESPPPEELSSACLFLSQLTHEEWKRHCLDTQPLLKALGKLALPPNHRSVRLAAASALGAFSVHALQREQQQKQRASGAAAASYGDLTTAQSPEALQGGSALRVAVSLLLLQLRDPLPDVRTAALSALCEAAGSQQQQEAASFYLVAAHTDSLWVEALEAINDLLHAEDKSAVAAVGLRAVGAVAPLLLQSTSLSMSSSSTPRAARMQVEASQHPCGFKAERDTAEGEVPSSEAEDSVQRQGAEAELLACCPLQEVCRSLGLLESVLRSSGGLGEDRPEKEAGRGDLHTSAETPAGLKQLKLHWNACHSIRLIFSSAGASCLLCCRLLRALWMGTCGCLRASQLTKVRCHAAAALTAIVKLMKWQSSKGASAQGFRPPGSPIQQLQCAVCTAPLLTEAWDAIAAANAKAAGLSASSEHEEHPGARAALNRYKESLRCNLECLIGCGLLLHSQELLNAAQGSWKYLQEPLQAEPLRLVAGKEPAGVSNPKIPLWALHCDKCARDRIFCPEAVFKALKQAMEVALKTCTFVEATQPPGITGCS
ncbi:LOW QUALITY PROTEIN: uncharacterized protein LOC113147293 [Cyclospora cayetanensis]|uniref:LOW QUALITY PROTEIN: uncharacterized protein LOC113147293 n=1 Tax=Cyclospora cayetanensis TaxID=88456 RepID=A0A6P6RZ73_9EIME|nr:LOW QUALITY PROTEIN: uncharacterized protein LOC113147293 [Cyclospora cayetanensis]